MIEAIRKIRSFERFGSVLGLKRMERLMEILGNPHGDMKFIHVAGTNGKGSVCKFIYEVLRESGYKAGLFTSPYVLVFNERIEFDGQYISDDDLDDCTDEVLAGVEEMMKTEQADASEVGSPTEFEIITAIAFVYFKKKKADYVVLEVGLGGRGDSTNIVKPLVSVITSISFDHMDRLGNTLAEIASEKAGIIKEGVPVVSNVSVCDAAEVISQAAKGANAKLCDVTELKYCNVKKALGKYVFDTNVCGTDYVGAEITMTGEHQIQNALTALASIEALRKSDLAEIKKDAVYRGLAKARQIGRFEILKENPYIIIDGAHNENGAETLKNTMKEHFFGKKILMIAGILADKDVTGILRHFLEITDDFIATEPKNARKLAAESLQKKIEAAGKKCVAICDPVLACERAIALSDKYDVILFSGSLYLLGKVRSCKWVSQI